MKTEKYLFEIWRPVVGFEGYYEVSNYGRIKSLNYNKTGCSVIMTPCDAKGYLRIILCKCGKRKSMFVHRIVAEAFLPNPDNFPCVNHKDENPKNNAVWNLEWCTVKYNTNYGTGIKRRSTKQSKPVVAIDPVTLKIVLRFSSASEAYRNGYSNVSLSVRKGVLRYGYIWQYV